MKKLLLFFLSIFLIFFSCTTQDPDGGCITALDCAEGEVCQNGECVEKPFGDTGNTGDSGDTGNTGNSGNSGDSGNTGSGTDDEDSVDDMNVVEDKDDKTDVDIVDPVCGDGNVEGNEVCDRGENNAELIYNELKTCNTDCLWNSFCGDEVVDYKDAQFDEDEVVLRLDGDSATQAQESSPKAVNRTIEGATRVDGKFGRGLNFSGTCEYSTEDYWTCENNGKVFWSFDPAPTNNFTMMAWFKAVDEHEIDEESAVGSTGTKGQRYLFGAENMGEDAGAGLSVGTNGITVYEHGTGYLPPVLVYETGLGTQWNHVALVYTEKKPSLYINGRLVKTGTISLKTVYPSTSVGSGDYGNFNGDVDEIRVVGRSLTEKEIRSAMGETCDDGSSNAAVTYGAQTCNTDCMVNSFCGDGILDSGEVCDRGAHNGDPGGCKSDCSAFECVPGTWTFSYTGAVQNFVTEYPGTYTIEAWGAQGGPGGAGASEGAGGLGGYAKGDLTALKGETFYIYVGQGNVYSTGELKGAFNGGGKSRGNGADNYRGAGGGASDVRIEGTELSNRVIVAGGGGGSSGNIYLGGGGGGLSGTDGPGALPGTGGTQSSGGTGYTNFNGSLGSGGSCDTSLTVAGGGGGYYGGGAGLSAGGGSGYIGGVTSGSMQNGVRVGSGEVKITLTCP